MPSFWRRTACYSFRRKRNNFFLRLHASLFILPELPDFSKFNGKRNFKRRIYSDLSYASENGAENINLVTGSHFIPKIAYYIEEAVKSGVKIPFCWNSSAYESTEMLELLKDKVKIWLPDLKTLSPELSKNLFDAENYPEAATKSIKWMIDNFPLKFSTEKAEKDFYDA